MKRKISLIMNILIVILELIGFVLLFKNQGGIAFQYYTEDSNILLFITSLIFTIYLFTNKKIPRWLSMLKYISTIGVTLTFLVVIFILAPMMNFNYSKMLLDGALLYQHLLCPVLSIITFLFFDELGSYSKKDNITSLSLTVLYSIILVSLNILELVKGPYPFLMVRNQSVLMSMIWLIVLGIMVYGIAFILRKIYTKNNS